jgi:hypothetical protein
MMVHNGIWQNHSFNDDQVVTKDYQEQKNVNPKNTQIHTKIIFLLPKVIPLYRKYFFFL